MPDDSLEHLAGLRDPVRRMLYRYVIAHPDGVSTERAAHGTNVRRSTAAYHLDKLVEYGLLKNRYERLTGRRGPGAGRPAKVYQRADRAIEVSLPPRDYAAVAGLLASVLEGDRADALEPAVEVAHEHGRQLWRHARTESGNDLWTRVWALLREAGYEPYEDGTDLKLGNCPYDALARSHRELICAMNVAIIRGLLEESGIGDRSAVPVAKDGACCVLIASNWPSASVVQP
jgi:predicted ArsR family transcriptional regulator